MFSKSFPKSFLTAVLLAVICVDIANSFSVSVPPVKSVCKSMHPGHHKYKPQEVESPFSITTDVSEVRGGNVVEIQLQGLGNRTFKGYYLQARDHNESPIGMFNPNTLAKVHNCGGVRSNAAHHANSEEKERVIVSWVAPKRFSGDITFTVTMLENFVTFWLQMKAPPVKVVS